MPDQEGTATADILELLKSQPVDLGRYEDLYKHFHSHPELSLHEEQTAATIAKHEALKAYGVHTGIGGHGIACVLRNGDGPTILLRADIDALPVKENTGLEYASQVRMTDKADGVEKPVMHACGHDTHFTCMLAAAEWMSRDEIRRKWNGTLIIIFQPAEERGSGSKAMLDDGLYNKIPTPDVVLGQHVMAQKTGTVAVRKGTIMMAADSFKIKLYGRGGHGSMPHLTIDPVVLAAQVVLRLQTIVSREVNPLEASVLTVGSLQAGSVENIIADEAVLMVDIRSSTPSGRERILKSMRRIVEKECEASGCVKPPTFERTREFPLTINDDHITEKLSDAFSRAFGEVFEPETACCPASEDVSNFATAVGKPSIFWFFGGIDKKKWDDAERDGRVHEDIPGNHSAMFAPVIQPTLETGIKTLCIAALTFLGSKK